MKSWWKTKKSWWSFWPVFTVIEQVFNITLCSSRKYLIHSPKEWIGISLAGGAGGGGGGGGGMVCKTEKCEEMSEDLWDLPGGWGDPV